MQVQLPGTDTDKKGGPILENISQLKSGWLPISKHVDFLGYIHRLHIYSILPFFEEEMLMFPTLILLPQ